MADDIFLTPEEQDERARKWLRENGPALAIGIALGLAAIFGWNQYQDNLREQAEQASALYSNALEEFNSSELSDIDAQVNDLKANHAGSSYASKAVLLKAKQLSVRDLPAAFDELQWVVDHAPEFGLVHTARIRQARIKLSLGELDAALALASHTPTQGFDSHYAELLGDVAVRQGDHATARAHYQAAIEALIPSQAGYAQVLTIKLDRLPAESSSATDEAAPNGRVEPNESSSETENSSPQTD